MACSICAGRTGGPNHNSRTCPQRGVAVTERPSVFRRAEPPPTRPAVLRWTAGGRIVPDFPPPSDEVMARWCIVQSIVGHVRRQATSPAERRALLMTILSEATSGLDAVEGAR